MKMKEMPVLFTMAILVPAMLVAVSLLPTRSIAQQGGDRPTKTADGLLSGTRSADGQVETFKGIPFAAPPVGDLRWRPPQPVKAWSGVRRADHFGDSCVEVLSRSHLPWSKEFMVQNAASEDCLYLNVWAPRTAGAAHHPVLFYIPGGGFREGSGEVPIYDGEQLAKTGVVFVTINYRLGALGFLAYPGLTAESPHHSSGNYGLLDQIAALRWVKQNIQAFGGDPNHVTIQGQSAGAFSVHELTASPLARGLFAGAIAESGSGVNGFPMHTLREAEEIGVQFATAHNAHSLKELRAIPADDLLPKSGQAPTAYPSSPIIDGWFLPASVNAIFAAGKQNDVPTITGLQADDARTLSPHTFSAEEFRKQAQERYGNMTAQFLQLYPSQTDQESIVAQSESARDRGKVSMYLWAVNRAKTAKTPAYTYYFTRAIPWPAHPEFGAFHTGEVPYVLRNLRLLDRPFQPIDFHISDVISTYWKNFAASGNPNGRGLPEWRPVSKGDLSTLEIGQETRAIPLADHAKEQFWLAYFNSPLGKNAPLF